MKIIKPGNLEKKDEIITFTCCRCGCIFKAKREEYQHEYYQIDDFEIYKAKCPFCGCFVETYPEEAKKQWNGY